MSVYCITSQLSVGCTFFDWSIHFLSGQKDFYQADQRRWIPLSNDPVLDVNAHGHLKNHPKGSIATAKQITELLNMPENQLYSVYPSAMTVDDAIKQCHILPDQIGQKDNWQHIYHFINSDYWKNFEVCQASNVKLIYVANDPNVSLYYLTSRCSTNIFPIVDGSKYVNLQETFFKNSVNSWNSLGLTEIWDQRERLALDLRPFLRNEENSNHLQGSHLWISCQELWTRGEVTALKMLKFLDLPVATERLPEWRLVYAKWQEIQLKQLEFNYIYQHIVDSIVNNWYYEIDLTFEQEVVIQHCLIYQHNLNLKTWQLTKFPTNTQDLHKLLEDNIHVITEY